MVWHVLQNVVHVVTVLIRDEYPAGAAVDLRETFTGRAYRWGVDHRHHLFQMILHQAVEEGFIGVLNVTQVDVLVDFSFETLILDPRALCLFFNGFHHFRQ